MPPAYLELLVERRLPAGTRSRKYLLGVEGGSVSGIPAYERVETRESATFVGHTLVIATSRWSGAAADLHPEERRDEIWEIDADGKLVVTITEQDGTRKSQTTLTYRRRA